MHSLRWKGDKAKVKNLAIENDKLQFTGKAEFPEGKLGMQLSTLYEIKINGLGEILFKLKKMTGRR